MVGYSDFILHYCFIGDQDRKNGEIRNEGGEEAKTGKMKMQQSFLFFPFICGLFEADSFVFQAEQEDSVAEIFFLFFAL